MTASLSSGYFNVEKKTTYNRVGGSVPKTCCPIPTEGIWLKN